LHVAKNSSFTSSSAEIGKPSSQVISAKVEQTLIVENEIKDELISENCNLESSQEENVQSIETEMVEQEVDRNEEIEEDIQLENSDLDIEEEPFIYIDESESQDQDISALNEVDDYNEIKAAVDEHGEEIKDVSPIAEENIEEMQRESEEDSSSIMDLISKSEKEGQNHTSIDQDSTPDLFADNNIHELNSEKSEENEILEEDKIETDQDLLEIPSFLRRQSK
jgi:hypothetical protein